MSVFSYEALDSEGQTQKGAIEADSPRQARSQLREKGWIPLLLKEIEEKRATKTLGHRRRIRWRSKASTAELALITRQLATLVQAGLPLEECLKAVSEQCEKPHINSLMLSVRSRVLEGYPFADSLSEYSDMFDDLFCAMVAAGEKSGHLDLILNRLADHMEQRHHMKGKILQALLYPMILSIVSVIVIGVLLSSVVPKVVAQFEHSGTNLPFSTQLLMDISAFIQAQGLYVILVFVLLLGLFKYLLRRKGIQIVWHRMILRLPLMGKIIKISNTVRFARTLSILSGSQIPLVEGMGIVAKVSSNTYVEQQVLAAAEQLRQGRSLLFSLSKSRLFSPMMLHMIASGERSGELNIMLERASDNQDREFSLLMTLVISIFEPVLIIIMSGIVLFIVIAILQPILALNNMVNL